MRKHPLTNLLSVAVLSAVLAACSASAIYNVKFHQHYSPQTLSRDHGNGTMPLLVYGTHVGASASALAETSARAMTGRNWGPPIEFIPSTDSMANRASRMVLLFGPAADSLPNTLCRSTAPGSVSNFQPDTFENGEALLAYCLDDAAMSAARLRFLPNAEPGSPDFAKTLQLAVLHLTPPRNPEHVGESCRPQCE